MIIISKDGESTISKTELLYLNQQHYREAHMLLATSPNARTHITTQRTNKGGAVHITTQQLAVASVFWGDSSSFASFSCPGMRDIGRHCHMRTPLN